MYMVLTIVCLVSLFFTALIGMKSQGYWPFLLLTVEGLGVIIFTILDRLEDEKLSKQWKCLTEGIFDHVVYGYYNYTRRSGAMVHTTHRYKMDVTTLYFSDGRTVVLRDRIDIDFYKGTKVKVLENGLGGRKVELVKDRQSES